MLNKYPLWKYLLVLAVAIFAFIYALPNLYPDDPAIQISGSSAAVEVKQFHVDKASEALKAAGLDVKAAQLQERAGLVRLPDPEAQLRARDVVAAALGEEFVVALNLAPTTPEWLKALGAFPMKLGLDLRGGVHFLMEVDMASALNTRFENTRDEIRDRLREERIRYRTVRAIDGGVEVQFASAELRNKARDLLRDDLNQFQLEEIDGDTFGMVFTITDDARREIQDYAISQNLTTIRNRVNELGVAEPVVQRQGVDRIVVQLPGIQDTAAAKRVLGRTANLEFRLVDWENDPATVGNRAPAGSEFLPFKGENRPPVLLKQRVIVTGDRVVNAQPNYDENGRPQVNIQLDTTGGRMMHRVTKDHVRDSMAVVFIETKPVFRTRVVDGQEVTERIMEVRREVINVATIQSALSSNFRITGLDSPAESSELALLLRAGALAAPMYYVEERTVGPSLGLQNIEAGIKSLILGFVLVLAFMLVYYRVFGLFANIALFMNLLLLVACMSLIPGATLSLPGMAGIVLTVGMAVDANVLIFSRIKEELNNGLSPQAAINAGYDRAFTTILDANITTLMVALVLFLFGTGPVKGFAVTLSIGILTSMFTAIIGTRAMVNLAYGGRQINSLHV